MRHGVEAVEVVAKAPAPEPVELPPAVQAATQKQWKGKR
jgi:hypothetical protein